MCTIWFLCGSSTLRDQNLYFIQNSLKKAIIKMCFFLGSLKNL